MFQPGVYKRWKLTLTHRLVLILQMLCIYSALTCVDQTWRRPEKEGTAGSVRASGSSSDTRSVGIHSSAGGDASTIYLPAGALQSQLLTSTGIEPASLVAVTSSYAALEEHSPGLTSVAPNTNVFASILIVPGFANDSAATMESKINQFESSSADELSGRTQLMYNCTSAANLWNLLDDPNAVSLEEFQRLNSSESVSGAPTSSNGTDVAREIVVVASIQFANCSLARNNSIGRPVLGNVFFGPGFIDSTESFYTMNATVLNGSTANSSPGGCTLRLEMAQATLAEVYPDCQIKSIPATCAT
jgi:hypothetical protein